MAFFQLPCERCNFFDRFDKGRDRGQLRADVHLEPAHANVGEFFGCAFVEASDGIEVDAEFVFRFAGGNVLVRFRVDIRVHAHGCGSDHAEFAGDFVEVAEFLFAFDIE